MVVDEDDEGRSNASSSFPPPLPPEDEDESSTIPYFIPRRPRVIRMRDLSPATREALTKEYFDAYDPWTGVRIAATLGLFISLFALFLAYKSRFHNRNSAKSAARNAAKTSLYLYDEEDLSISSSVTSGMDTDPLPGFRLQEVYVGGASSLVGGASSVVAALKVKRSSSSSRGGGPHGRGATRREELDASRSLPCSPLKDEEAGTRGQARPEIQSHAPIVQRQAPEMVDRTHPLRIDGPNGDGHAHRSEGPISYQMEGLDCSRKKKHKHGRRSLDNTGAESVVVVVAKKPQDYRSRSTVVSIARRPKLSS